MLRILTASLLTTSALTGVALAQDSATSSSSLFAEPVAQHYKDWSGVYFGAVASVGLYTNEMSDQWCVAACDAPDMGSWGGGFGVTAGWNTQQGNAVYGVEADISWVDFDNALDISDYMEHRASMDWLATVRGRVGLAMGRVLAYVTGGIAIADLDYSSWYVNSNEGFRTGGTQVGIAAGAGVEVAVNGRLSAKGEYMYVGFPDDRTDYFDGAFDPEYPMTYRSDIHMLRVGLNYSFGGDGISDQGPMALDAPSRDWSGVYLGGVGTAGLFRNEASDHWCATACDAADMADWGGGIGGTFGWNTQRGMFVYGVEGDISWLDFHNSLVVDEAPSYRMEHNVSWDWLATLRGRAGLATGNVLVYVTGGIAIADPDYSSWYVPPFDNEGFRTGGTQVGIAAGAGVEVAVNDRFSVKGEYLYVGLPDVRTDYWDGVFDPEDKMVYRSDAHIIRFGVNYAFSDGGNANNPAPMFNWSGAYAGIVGGAAMFADEMSDQWCWTACDAPDMASWGGFVGGTVGWNVQNGALVYGVEGDLAWTGFENSLSVTNGSSYIVTHTAEWDWLATIRGRLGLASGNTLFYVTGGAAIASADYSSWYGAPYDNEGYRTSGTDVGITGGAGVEVALGDKWSAKGEYLYVGLPSVTTDYQNNPSPNPGEDVMTYRSQSHMLRFGLNRMF